MIALGRSVTADGDPYGAGLRRHRAREYGPDGSVRRPRHGGYLAMGEANAPGASAHPWERVAARPRSRRDQRPP
jgi:hypothetical protein